MLHLLQHEDVAPSPSRRRQVAQAIRGRLWPGQRSNEPHGVRRRQAGPHQRRHRLLLHLAHLHHRVQRMHPTVYTLFMVYKGFWILMTRGIPYFLTVSIPYFSPKI